MAMKKAAAALLLFASSLALASPNGYHQQQQQQHQTAFGSSFVNGFASNIDQAFGASNTQPLVQTKATYNGCSSATGCGGVTLENGKVTHSYGNPAAIGVSGGDASNLSPQELHKNFAAQASDVNAAFAGGQLPSDGPFWWANDNSPFKNAHEQYMKWLNEGINGVQIASPCAVCALTNQIQQGGKVEGVIASNKIDLSQNPFLNGQFASGFNAGVPPPPITTGPTKIDLAKNPFLNGNIQMGNPGGFSTNPFLNGAGCSGTPGGCGNKPTGFIHQTGTVNVPESKPTQITIPGVFTSSGCSAGTPGCTSGVIYQSGSVSQETRPTGCGGASGSCDYEGQFVQQQQEQEQLPFEQQTQKPFPRPQPNRPTTSLPHPPGATAGGFRGETGATGELTVSCTGQDRVCIEKYLCVNGFVNDDGRDILQARTSSSCKTNTEVCCKIRPQPNEPYSPGNNLIDSTSLQSSVSNSVVQSTGNQVLTPGAEVYTGLTFVPGGGEKAFEKPNVGPGLPYLPPKQPEPTTQRPVYPTSSVDVPVYQPPPQTPPPYVPPKQTPPPYVPPQQTPPPYVPPKQTPPPYVPPKQTPPPYIPPKQTPPPYVPPKQTPPPYVPPSQTPPPYVPPKQTPPPYVPPKQTPPPYVPPKQTPPPYVPPSSTQPPFVPQKTNAPPYLPPKEDERPQSSSGSQQIVPGPNDSEGSLLLDNTRNPTRPPPKDFVPIVPSGCAAALKCTPIELCGADGVISNTTVVLTKEQQEFRVPLTDCKDDRGGLGKCCRDPTYTDPWPTNQLGQWVPGAFGDTGAYRGENYRRNGNPGLPKNNNVNVNVNSNGFAPGARPEGSINRPIFTNNPNRPTKTSSSGYNPKNPSGQQTNSLVQPPQGNRNNNRPPPSTFNTAQVQQYPSGGGQSSCGVRQPGSPPGNKNNFEADFGEIPWQAMVLLQTNRSLLCGGVITAPDAVVTSAHCVDGLNAKNVLIKGGEWKLGVDEEPKPFQIVQVKEIIRHPGYQPGNLQNDLAILMLAENLRYAQNIGQICLPPAQAQQSIYSKKTQCITTGWGKKVLQINIPNAIMHTVDMNILQPNQCQAQISQNYPHLLEQYNQNNCICGQPINVEANVCKVDIGSALACTGPDGSYYMEGVYSWDSGCTSPNQIASFFKFDATWYEDAMNSAKGQITGQGFETIENSQIFKRGYEQIGISAQPSQIHSYAVSGFGGNQASYATSRREAFQQAVGGHVHGGPDCHCTPNGK